MQCFFRQIGYFRYNCSSLTGNGLTAAFLMIAAFSCGQSNPPAMPDARTLLEKAVRRVPRVEPYMVRFRQEWAHAGLRAHMQGLLAVGPARRSHLHLRIEIADAIAELRIYCDSQTFYREERLPHESPKLMRYTWADLDQAIAQANLGETESARVRDAFLAEHGYQSLRFRLTELLTRYQWGPPQPTTLPDGREAWLLEGSWNEQTLKEAFRGVPPQAPEIPRRCRAFLLRQDTWWSGDSLWPARLEWWGLPRGEKEDKLLAWLEYQTPRRLEADAPELRSPFSDAAMAQATPADVSQLLSDILQRRR
ncbi:MAG: hypothetical protein NZM42_10680 [Gemmatales bacterium]|nr:hypothetical protein [Gemmatales bacterium]MDW8223267.1 hypothetical protein [Gemmatales bacterium]